MYQDTTKGTEIFFKCNPGFVPAGRMRAVCAGDGRWIPDPATLVCSGEIIMITSAVDNTLSLHRLLVFIA